MEIQAANIGTDRKRVRVEPLPKEPPKDPKELPKSPAKRETKRRKREKVPA